MHRIGPIDEETDFEDFHSRNFCPGESGESPLHERPSTEESPEDPALIGCLLKQFGCVSCLFKGCNEFDAIDLQSEDAEDAHLL